MDLMEIVTDRCIRRALGFAGLAIGTVMLALSFDLALALRSGADLVAVTAGVMLLAAWYAPRRDMRFSETWGAMNDLRPDFVRRQPRPELQRLLRETFRRRLLWHAERVGLLALALWIGTAMVHVAKAF
jgi:hypothetical protein